MRVPPIARFIAKWMRLSPQSAHFSRPRRCCACGHLRKLATRRLLIIAHHHDVHGNLRCSLIKQEFMFGDAKRQNMSKHNRISCWIFNSSGSNNLRNNKTLFAYESFFNEIFTTAPITLYRSSRLNLFEASKLEVEKKNSSGMFVS